MAHLLVIIPLFISFFGIYYYILTASKYDKAARFIPFVLLCIVTDSVLSEIIPGYFTNAATRAIFTLPLLLWFLTFLFFFLYGFTKRNQRTGFFMSLFLLIMLIAATVFSVYQLKHGLNVIRDRKLLIFSYIYVTVIVLFYFAVLLYKMPKISWRRAPQQILIYTLFVQFAIIGFFLTGWFVINFRMGKLFSDTLFISFKLTEITVSLTLYFFLFEMYKRKILQKKLNRLEGFVSVPEIPSPKEAPPQHAGEKSDEPVAIHEDRYGKSLLNAKKMAEYKNRVEDFFNHDKNVYLNPDFNMELLSSHTGISRYHLSQVFNLALHTSFPVYVNRRRILHACELMKEGNGSLKISELMEKCGFRSRASFHSHFKKVTGCMPVDYPVTCREKSTEKK